MFEEKEKVIENPMSKSSEGHVFIQDEKVQQNKRTANQPGKQPETETSEGWYLLFFHIAMYSLADRMLIEGLKTPSKSKFEGELRQKLDLDFFPGMIRDIYTSTPQTDRGLRDLVVRLTMEHLTELRPGKDGTLDVLQNELLEQVLQYPFDLLVTAMDQTVADKRRYGVYRPNGSFVYFQ